MRRTASRLLIALLPTFIASAALARGGGHSGGFHGYSHSYSGSHSHSGSRSSSGSHAYSSSGYSSHGASSHSHASASGHATTHAGSAGHRSTYSTVAKRDKDGRIARSSAAKHEFEKETGYPHGRKGYVVDHVVPLKRGGADAPSNMQWQTIEAAKAKDKTE